ncbi:hypothetical protein CYG49_03325 [Candidatus Saccharibacteria bacterium]|nr:MAG: hypothetical protein CYG49_03325 [Candidatus Saccharibacteria bacterium]
MKSFDWGTLAFGSKDRVNTLRATFIAAPREMSQRRFTQLVREYLPKGNIVLGIAKEDFIEGFEGQPQFKTLQLPDIQEIINKVDTSTSPFKIYPLLYFQRETKYLLKELDFRRAVFINGSWKYSFHTREPFYVLINRKIPYELVSPFSDEDEAREYEAAVVGDIERLVNGPKDKIYTDTELLAMAEIAATQSFDNSFQTGAVLAKKSGLGYRFLLSTFNRVVPYQTYAMHHGASREKNFSPPHDMNHYDAVHAEVEMIIQAGKRGIDLTGTTLLINLLFCPNCARMLIETDIDEFVYVHDHSNSYAIAMMEAAGKKIRRIVTETGV